MVIADLEERERQGITKYGTTLQTFNGRNALVDAYQESLNQSQYLKQAIIEKARLTEALLWLYEHQATVSFQRDGFGDVPRVTLSWGVWAVYADDLLSAVEQAMDVERVLREGAWNQAIEETLGEGEKQ